MTPPPYPSTTAFPESPSNVGSNCTIAIRNEKANAPAVQRIILHRIAPNAAYVSMNTQNTTENGGYPARKQSAEAQANFQSGRQLRDSTASSILQRPTGSQV